MSLSIEILGSYIQTYHDCDSDDQFNYGGTLPESFDRDEQSEGVELYGETKTIINGVTLYIRWVYYTRDNDLVIYIEGAHDTFSFTPLRIEEYGGYDDAAFTPGLYPLAREYARQNPFWRESALEAVRIMVEERRWPDPAPDDLDAILSDQHNREAEG